MKIRTKIILMAVIAVMFAVSFGAGAQTKLQTKTLPKRATQTETQQQQEQPQEQPQTQKPQALQQQIQKPEITEMSVVKTADSKVFRTKAISGDLEKYFILSDRIVLLKKNNGLKLEIRSFYKGKPITWKSSNTAVVTIDQSGNVTAKNIAGQSQVATITATSGEITDECTVYVVDKLIADETAIGKGIDITAAEAFSFKEMKKSPIFDMDLIYARNLWGTSPMNNKEEFNDITSASASQTIKEFNSKNKVSYSGVFSASAEVNYKSSNSTMKAAGFTRIQSQIRTKDHYLKELNLSRLKEFLTETFISDLKTKDAAYMINMYGSHVVAQCYYGGVVQLDFVTSSYKQIDTKEINTRVKASAFGIGAQTDDTWKTEQQNFESNTDFHYYVDGGILGATNLIQFQQYYQGWVKGLKEGKLNVVCGFDEFDEARTMFPLWDIAKLVNPAKAEAINTEFNNRFAINGTKLAGIDANYAKRKSTPISTGQITKSSPNTTVTREKGDNDIYSANGKKTNWMLKLWLVPNPSTKSVKLKYEYYVIEGSASSGATTFRMDGNKTINVGVAFTNTDEQYWEVTNGEIEGKHHEWFLERTNKEYDMVRKLQLRIDADSTDDSGYIGFDATLNFFYVAP